jgi:hypothetical protein
MESIQLSSYLPWRLVEFIQPHLDLSFLEPNQDGRYVDRYRARRDVKILDNGLIEFGESVRSKDLVEYASWVDATYIIPPDKIGDWSYNLEQAEEMVVKYRVPPARIMVCLGGPLPPDFKLQALKCRELGFGGICLPYRLNRHPTPQLGMRCHLLGLKWPEEYKSYVEQASGSLSLDSTEFISGSIAKKCYEMDGFTTTKRPKNYTDVSIYDVDVPLILKNIKWFKTLTSVPSKVVE